jgi:nitroimidazol reductase NimA-like FMN-containing flavoprotein (pyridoxamine 5'-phosphate oxidase superfamily)
MSDLDDKYPIAPRPGTIKDALAGIKELLSEQKLGVLATCQGGEPHASIIGFAARDDLRRIFFVTPRASRKYRNLAQSGRAALLIDSRSNQLADFHEACAVTANGSVEEPRGEERDEALRLFLERHSHLADFARSPSCALFAIDVVSYRFVNRFQTVTEIDFD